MENRFLFKGGIQDRATGWIHCGNRWYNTTLGRWTQQDTLDTPLDPLNANRYAYAGADPINNIDPTGQSTLGSGVKCVAGALGRGITGALAGAAAGSAVPVIETAAGRSLRRQQRYPCRGCDVLLGGNGELVFHKHWLVSLLCKLSCFDGYSNNS